MTNKFWKYYLALEEDTHHLFRYIEPDERNFSVYSVEITRLYLSTCAEVDVILKSICQLIDEKKEVANIQQYAEVLITQKNSIFKKKVILESHRLTFSPFGEWTLSASPDWWKKHNKVKHDREKNYTEANLGNFLSSLSALYLLNIYYEREKVYSLCKNSTYGMYPELESISESLKSRTKLFSIEGLWNLPY